MERAEIPNPVRILLVEDSATVREAVASEFLPDPDFEIVGEVASLSEARGVLGTADVVILDLGLPDGSGTDLIRELRDANPQASDRAYLGLRPRCARSRNRVWGRRGAGQDDTARSRRPSRPTHS